MSKKDFYKDFYNLLNKEDIWFFNENIEEDNIKNMKPDDIFITYYLKWNIKKYKEWLKEFISNYLHLSADNVFFYLNDDNSLRYFMIWERWEKGFTWVIYDYVWSGNYQNFYFVNWKQIDNIDEWEAEDEMAKALTSINLNTIYDILEKFFNYDTDTFEFTLKSEFINHFTYEWERHRSYRNNDLAYYKPIVVWLTSFR